MMLSSSLLRVGAVTIDPAWFGAVREQQSDHRDISRGSGDHQRRFRGGVCLRINARAVSQEEYNNFGSATENSGRKRRASGGVNPDTLVEEMLHQGEVAMIGRFAKKFATVIAGTAGKDIGVYPDRIGHAEKSKTN
jgi:hypothetical protein